MSIIQAREIAPAARLENVRYAIRDLACIADEVVRQGHKILPLNIGDPLNFDFQTPAHMIEAVYRAMRDGKNGYSSSSGIPKALDAIRGEAARKGITNIQDLFPPLRASAKRSTSAWLRCSIRATTCLPHAPTIRSIPRFWRSSKSD